MAKNLEFEKHLNPAQLEAVLHTGTPLLVLAGAGSGKTRVITYKIAYLINHCGFDPRDMFAVTFTNKASNEMRERVNLLLGEQVELWVKTFHSSAAKLLRIWGKSIGVNTSFSIIDQQDQKALMKRIVGDLDIDPDTYKPEKYVFLINRAKDRLLSADEAAAEDFSTDYYFDEIYGRYEKTLNRENLFDFGDLISKLTRGLRENDELRNRIRERFRYVLVDEFQDTNHAQYELVKLLSSGEGNVCVVGDDDQSIYGFRGARVENILNFSKENKNCKIIKLEENYRSFQNILTASSELINFNSSRMGKKLFTKKGKGEPLVFCKTGSDYDEARFIAGTIQKLVLEDEYGYSDVAIFYRMNAQSRVFEAVFNQERIPYTIVGGLRFFEREEVKDILAYVRLAMNPMDEIALRRIVNKPPRRLGKITVEAIIKTCMNRGFSLYETEDKLEIASSRKKLVLEFTKLIHDIGERLQSQDPPSLLRHIYEVTDYIKWLQREQKDEKVKNLDELYNAVYEFHQQNPAASLIDFVEEVSLNQGIRDDEFGERRVFLITLHNAKGLEFPVVFMAGMEEGVFPHYRSGEALKDLQEERRLCYVGMTRAMERLYLTAAKSRMLYGRTIERDVSIFIGEIPKELLITKNFGLASLQSPSTSPLQRGRTPAWRGSTGGSGKKVVERVIEDIEQGSRVIHKSFGRGIVQALDNGIAEIAFEDGKVMKFLLKYTPIEIDR